MSHYMRFFFTSPAPGLADLAAALPSTLPRHSLRHLAPEAGPREAELFAGETLCAALDLTLPDKPLFADETGEFIEALDAGKGQGDVALVRGVLTGCTAILAAQVLWQGRTTDEVMDDLDPFWDWVASQHKGLLQADTQGFFEGYDRVLAL
ncbi:hypothetical protein [Vannielia litorea]|uniref:hypothetical protein n=1 Tax=Vannielia litorea TaxID=1217970 RepID=UPI001C985B1D|nr:hypothetical protein [Vannielia litorea]MBY6047156.1 hypothetical protein [Vannielia litorea]MBY6074570.1 hypothetical protein [Vannielia litorea]